MQLQHSDNFDSLADFLALFPSLTRLDLRRLQNPSLPDIKALASASCASSLRGLDLGQVCGKTADEIQPALQQLASIQSLHHLQLTLICSRHGPALDLSALAALSQLELLYLDMPCDLQAGSLRALASGCTRLQHLFLFMDGARVRIPAGTGPAAAPGSSTWPSLYYLHLPHMSIQEAYGLLTEVFCSCPVLSYTSLYLELPSSGQGASASDLRGLCQKQASLPGEVTLTLQVELPGPAAQLDQQPLLQGQQLLQQQELAAELLPALEPLKGRILTCSVGLHLKPEHVALLVGALGRELRGLDLASSTGAVGSVALEATSSLPALRWLKLPRPLPELEELGWQESLIQACTVAQTHAQRTEELIIYLSKHTMPHHESLQRRWNEAWAALPQPETGPKRVLLRPPS